MAKTPELKDTRVSGPGHTRVDSRDETYRTPMLMQMQTPTFSMRRICRFQTRNQGKTARTKSVMADQIPAKTAKYTTGMASIHVPGMLSSHFFSSGEQPTKKVMPQGHMKPLMVPMQVQMTILCQRWTARRSSVRQNDVLAKAMPMMPKNSPMKRYLFALGRVEKSTSKMC